MAATDSTRTIPGPLPGGDGRPCCRRPDRAPDRASAPAANLAAVTIGTETSGSILGPGGANGIVGIKPTVGLVSRSGIIPITADQDTAGPLTRTVTDAAILLGVIAGYDRADPATRACLIPGNCFTDYTRFLRKNALRRRPHRGAAVDVADRGRCRRRPAERKGAYVEMIPALAAVDRAGHPRSTASSAI